MAWGWLTTSLAAACFRPTLEHRPQHIYCIVKVRPQEDENGGTSITVFTNVDVCRKVSSRCTHDDFHPSFQWLPDVGL